MQWTAATSISIAGMRTLILTGSAFALAACAALAPPLEPQEVASFAGALEGELAMIDAALADDLTVDMAVALAVQRNRSIRAKHLEAALSRAKVMVESGAMLPSAMAEASYSHRNRPQQSRSSASSTYSTSSDDDSRTQDITLGWNILDFGLSYVRSRQALDLARKQEEDIRRAAHQIAEETTKAFWRAVAYRKLAPGMSALEAEVRESLRLTQVAAKDKAIDPLDPISLQRDLLDVQREVMDQLVFLAGAEAELKDLLGAPPGRDLSLDGTAMLDTGSTIAPYATEDVTAALRQRPEIRQHMYDLRIGEAEVYAKILEALPGINLTRSYSSDANPYLFDGNWVSWGASVAGDLVRLVRLKDDLDVVGSQERFDRQLALATAATIVMQVHVARAKLAVNEHAYRLAAESADVQHRLLKHTQSAVKAGKLGKQRLVREKLETVLADVRVILSLADYQSALAGYARTRGDDVVRENPPLDAPLELQQPVAQWRARPDGARL